MGGKNKSKDTVKNKEPLKMKCINCGEEKTTKRNFYISYSDLYSTYGRIPICHDCIAERYMLLMAKYRGNKLLALKHCCLNFDIYYDGEFAKTLINQKELLVQNYIKKLNQNARFRGKTSLDTEIEKEKIVISESAFKENKIEITDKIRFIWGTGFTDDEYRILEMRYKEYEDYYDLEDLAKKQTIRELCTIRLLADRARMADNDKAFSDYMKLISNKLQDSGLKPNQNRAFGESRGETFAMKMKIYETKKPVMKRLEEYEDVDGFGAYINRNMIKPLAVAEGFATGTYSLDSGSENIELKEDFKQAVNKVEDGYIKEDMERDKEDKKCEQHTKTEN